MNNLLYVLLLFQYVSGGELILVLLAVFLLFGPNKIPEIARKIAKGLNDIKKTTDGFRDEVNNTIGPIKKEFEEDKNSNKNGNQNKPDNNKPVG